MTPFIIIFFFLYSLIHIYLYRKIVRAFNLNLSLKLFLISFLTFTTLSPALWKVLDKNGFDTFYIAFFSLMWMGYLIYFFLSGIIIDFLVKDKRRNFYITLLLTLILGTYSHIETYYLKVEKYRIFSEKIKEPVKILHISDLHLGPVIREDKVSLVLKVYKKEKPDIVVATGDIVDGNADNIAKLSKLLSKMNPPLGKYAVVGNHEFYAGIEKAIKFLEDSGFKVLGGEYVKVNDFLIVAGVDDNTGKYFGYKIVSEEEILKNVDTKSFVILLKHRPKVSKEALNYVDLILSGHTHGGVLFFVGYTVLRLIYETDRGIKELRKGKYIIVSKGVGTGGPPMRLLSPPDIIIIELLPVKP